MSQEVEQSKVMGFVYCQPEPLLLKISSLFTTCTFVVLVMFKSHAHFFASHR